MASPAVAYGFFEQKCLVYRGFLEKRDAQDLQDFVQREVHVPFFPYDGHQHIGANRNPDLRLHSVRRSPIKRLDSQMLLDPTEEQFDLPATSINVRDRQRWQVEIVAQEDEPLPRLDVAVDHATQGIGVELRCHWTTQDDRLVATQSRDLVHRTRHATTEVEVGFRSGHEVRQPGTQAMKSAKIEIASIHHIEGTRFDRQDVEDVDVVGLAIGNQHKTRDIPMQVDERVKFDSSLVASKWSPRKKREAEVDGRGIQRVGGLLELNPKTIGEIQSPRSGDQDMSEVLVDPPVAQFVGIGEGTPSNDTAKPRMVKFFVEGVETDFDVSQALAIGQLSESHAEKLIETREAANPPIAVIANDASVELAFGKGVDQLRKDVAIVVHEPCPDASRRMGNGSKLLWSSNRSQRISRLNSTIATRCDERHRP
jgi:hypothetical protein